MSEKHRKEIEFILAKSESNVSKRLQKLYKELAEEITQDIIELAEQIEQDDKFSKKLQKERLEAIRSQMYAKVDQLKGEEKKNIYDFLTHDGHVAFNELFYDFEMTEKMPLTFAMMTDRQIATIINTPVAQRKLSTRLKGNSTKMKQNMNRVLTRGFAKGWSTQKMAVQIAEIGGADYRRGMTIARTESGRVTSVTRQKSQEHAKELGINTQKRWVSTLDGDTRTNHRKLDGQEVGIDEYFEIDGHKALQPHMFGVAREDCNCRCRTINVVVGYEPKLRRDNETGEEIEYQNYEDWLEGKNGSDEREVVDNEISYNDSLAQTNMKKMVGKDNYENFVEHLNHIDNERVKQMFNLLGDKISFKPISNAHPHARGSNIQLDITSFVGDQYHYPMKTVYHEAGHAFDSLGMELLTGKNGFAVGKKKIKVLGKMVEVDDNVYHASGLPDYKLKESFNRDLWRAINGSDLPMFEDLGTKPRKRAEKREWEDKRSEIYAALQKNTQKFQTEYKDKFKENPSMYVALSDMMESTGWFYGTLGAGHGKDYWKKTGMAETEFFAHATEMVASKEAEKVMREIFPTGINAWEKLVDDMLERVK
jgi:hypothetical protein